MKINFVDEDAATYSLMVKLIQNLSNAVGQFLNVEVDVNIHRCESTGTTVRHNHSKEKLISLPQSCRDVLKYIIAHLGTHVSWEEVCDLALVEQMEMLLPERSKVLLVCCRGIGSNNFWCCREAERAGHFGVVIEESGRSKESRQLGGL
jgi:hypothetical protein